MGNLKGYFGSAKGYFGNVKGYFRNVECYFRNVKYYFRNVKYYFEVLLRKPKQRLSNRKPHSRKAVRHSGKPMQSLVLELNH